MELPRIGTGSEKETLAFPLMAEDVPLRRLPALAGLAAGVLAMIWAHVLSDPAGSAAGRLVAGVLFVVGLAAVVLIVICRRFQVVVTTRTVEGTAGPFRVVVPTGSVEAATRRPASSWRRLFATEEVEIRYTLGSGRAVLPSRDGGRLVAVLVEDDPR